MGRFTGQIMRNMLIGGMLATYFWLALWPFSVRSELESELRISPNVHIFTRTADLSVRSSASPSERKAAELELTTLIQSGLLAVEGPITYSGITGSPPQITISETMISLGLVQLTSGTFNGSPTSYLAQVDSPYTVGEAIQQSGEITGTARIAGSRGIMTDAVLLVGSGAAFPASAQSVAAVYAITEEDQQVEEVRHLLNTALGVTYDAAPIYDYYLATQYNLEANQRAYQRYSALFLLAGLILGLQAEIGIHWLRHRQTLRIERMLGRSLIYFLRSWLVISLQRWMWGIGLVTMSAVVYAAPQGTGAVMSVLAIAAGITLACLLVTLAFGVQAIQASLASSNIVNQAHWQDTLIPATIGFGFVLGLTVLASSLLQIWISTEHQLRELGADQFLAVTTPPATTPLSNTLCHDLQGVTSCAAYGVANIHLWTPETNLEDSLSGLGRFNPADAIHLRIELQEGRFPEPDVREVLVNEKIVDDIQSLYPAFGLGLELALGYKVVGVISTPEAPANDFRNTSLYTAPLYIHTDAPAADFPAEYFLSPLGISALMLTIPYDADLTAIKEAVRQDNSNIEFLQPASFTLALAVTLRSSIRIIGIMALLSLISVSVVLHHHITLSLLRKRQEVIIWRILGMLPLDASKRLGKEIITAPITTSLLGALCGLGIVYMQNPAHTVRAITTGGLAVVGITTMYVVLLRLHIFNLFTGQRIPQNRGSN